MNALKKMTYSLGLLLWLLFPINVLGGESVKGESSVGIEFENDYDPAAGDVPVDTPDTPIKQPVLGGKKLPQTGSRSTISTVATGLVISGSCLLIIRKRILKESLSK